MIRVSPILYNIEQAREAIAYAKRTVPKSSLKAEEIGPENYPIAISFDDAFLVYAPNVDLLSPTGSHDGTLRGRLECFWKATLGEIDPVLGLNWPEPESKLDKFFKL